MAEKTEIAWCDSTFNPWIGCTKVGPGCDNCYAEADFGQRKKRAVWGAGEPRSRTSVANWKNPMQWNKQHWAECPECGWRGNYGTPSHPVCEKCGTAAVPARRRVFCSSLADVFDNEVPDAWRMDLFSLIAQTPNLDWLLLTKRIGNVMKMCQRDGLMFDQLANVWIGATICNQEEADRDIPKLLSIPAKARFLSMEPLLGPVDLALLGTLPRSQHTNYTQVHDMLDWVVVGGESGPNARPMHPDWVRSLRDQCTEAGTPFLFKQWGEWAPNCLCDKPVGCAETPRPEPGKMGCMFRCGKKAAGRLLDGVQYDGYPEVSK